MIEEIKEELSASCVEAIKALRKKLTKVRTGRANPNVLSGIKVDYYGVPTPIGQIGSIKVTDARTIIIQPWEKTLIKVIEKAILSSNLNLNPNNDGSVIRLPIPALTGASRKILTREVREIGEQYKITLRGYRRDANEMLKALEKESDITEDDLHRGLGQTQDLIKAQVSQIDKIIAKKEAEILEV